MKVLYTSGELHRTIKAVLADPRPHERRVVLVAYIGESAEAFLPHPKGLEIVCALEPGATSAQALIRLRSRGAKISKADRLHMKVYWSSTKGAVICSANVSARALGKGLKEAGVWLPKDTVDITSLLRYAAPQPVHDSDLRTLARQSDRMAAAWPARLPTSKRESASLADWLASSAGKPWKLGAWGGDDGLTAKASKAEALTRHGVREPAFVRDCAKGQFQPGDWVLNFRENDARNASWMYVDFVTRVPESDKRAFNADFPYQAVQVNEANHYPEPPFRLDGSARRAIAGAVLRFGVDRLVGA